ncbi:MAG: membrane dipeptidase [Chloroflexi bacterium]|nr:membrane dipeptidase [Chloroflexota bacterium]
MVTVDPVSRPNKGFHPFLERENPYLIVDACMQGWADADYANAHRHGVTVFGVTAFLPYRSLDRALEELMFWRLVARKHPNTLVVETADDIRRARREGRAAFLLSAQDGGFVDRSLHRLEAFYRLGLRVLIPAYNAANSICAGCLDHENLGLTRFGELVVAECNRLGLLLDGSHVNKRSTLEIMERSGDPIVFSHSNVRALVDVPRNVDDEQIAACARNGGVIGVANFGPFTKKADMREQPTIADLLEHVDYIAQLTGTTANIGLGTDMSLGTYPDHDHDPWGEPSYPNWAGDYGDQVSRDVRSPLRALRDFNCYPQVLDFADALLARGYRESDVHGILGENFLRVYAQVWK